MHGKFFPESVIVRSTGQCHGRKFFKHFGNLLFEKKERRRK